MVNLVQSAVTLGNVPLIIVHTGLVACWLVYFPMMIWFTHTRRESKQVNAFSEFCVMTGLIGPPFGTFPRAA